MAAVAFRAEAAPLPDVSDAGAIRLTGRITFDEAAGARRTLLDVLGTIPATRVVLELSGLEDLDTAGAAVLAEVLKAGESRNKRVLLCRPSESVTKIFRLAGFSEVLDCCCPDAAEVRRRLETPA